MILARFLGPRVWILIAAILAAAILVPLSNLALHEGKVSKGGCRRSVNWLECARGELEARQRPETTSRHSQRSGRAAPCSRPGVFALARRRRGLSKVAIFVIVLHTYGICDLYQ